MKYAEVNGIKVEAAKGVKGFCPSCGSELIPKCGTRKINHWAHKGFRTCDSWWEPETEWHRSWKNMFPEEWQEIILPDKQTGEKHIADIRTNQGLVIEFQHSFIKPDELQSRENFYKNLIWVVDGTRLKRDYPRFLKGKDSFQKIKEGIFRIDFPEDYFPSNWLESSVPVVFDFLGSDKINKPSEIGTALYCLFPVKIGKSVVIAEIKRNSFINNCIDGELVRRIEQFMCKLCQIKKERQDQIDFDERQRVNMIIKNFNSRSQYPKNRRF